MNSVKSRTLEYIKKWHEKIFFNDSLEVNDNNKFLNLDYNDVYLDELLPDYKWKEDYKIFGDIKSLISNYTKMNDKQMLIVFGEQKIGSGMIATWIVNKIVEDYNKIFVYKTSEDLKEFEWKDMNAGIADRIIKALGISFADLEGKILILDGFDDIGIKNCAPEIFNAMYWEFIVDSPMDEFLLILVFRRSNIACLNKIECDNITLQAWNKEQIKQFYKVFSEDNDNGISVMESSLSYDKYREVFGIPLISYLILALKISANRFVEDLYNRIFSLDHGIYNLCIKDNENLDIPVEEIRCLVYSISQKIAFWIFENNSKEEFIPQKEYYKIYDTTTKEYVNLNIEQMEYHLKMVRYLGGLGTEEIYFVNRNIYQYFASEYIFESMNRAVKDSKEELAATLGNLLKRNRLSFRMIDFLSYKVLNGDINKEMNKIITTFQLMLDNGMTFYTKQCFDNVIQCELFVFVNMLDIVHFSGRNYYKFKKSIGNYLLYARKPFHYNYPGGSERKNINLSKVDLKEVDLEGVKLSYYDLDGADLKGLDLKEVDLRRTTLRQINLEGIDLKGVDLRNVNLRGLDLREKDLQNANLLGASFDEEQVEYLEKKYDLKGTLIFPNGSNTFISYDKYCEKRQ